MSVGMTDSKDQSKIELTSMTRVALSDPKRLAAAELCDNALANTIDLYHQVKQAHWTVKGPHFYARHELFDKLADRLRLYADDLAERCVMLGAVPHGTVRDAANRSTLKPYTAGMVDGMQHIRVNIVYPHDALGPFKQASKHRNERQRRRISDDQHEIIPTDTPQRCK